MTKLMSDWLPKDHPFYKYGRDSAARAMKGRRKASLGLRITFGDRHSDRTFAAGISSGIAYLLEKEL